jgi:hypothetical protein
MEIFAICIVGYIKYDDSFVNIHIDERKVVIRIFLISGLIIKKNIIPDIIMINGISFSIVEIGVLDDGKINIHIISEPVLMAAKTIIEEGVLIL